MDEDMTSDLLLNLLEQLLSITEPLKQYLSPEDFEAWQNISAATADFRSGDDVSNVP